MRRPGEPTEFERLVKAVNRELRALRPRLGAGPCRKVDTAELVAFIAERFAAFSFDNERGLRFEVDTPYLLAWHLASGRELKRIGAECTPAGPDRRDALEQRSRRFEPVFEELKLRRRRAIEDREREG